MFLADEQRTTVYNFHYAGHAESQPEEAVGDDIVEDSIEPGEPVETES